VRSATNNIDQSDRTTLTARQVAGALPHTVENASLLALWSNGFRVVANEHECSKAFRNFTNRLNREVYGASFRKGRKRFRVISVLEKDADGRFHYHAAIELPAHVMPGDFEALIRECWSKVHWGYDRISVAFDVDPGWIRYMLKLRQKSGLQAWPHCIDWQNFYNG
jgi:hypothetical protein